jgi:RNA polymerase sigma-B factor
MHDSHLPQNLNPGESSLLYRDVDTPDLFREYARTRRLELRNELVLRHRRLVRQLVTRFSTSGACSEEDLTQVGFLGLITAIERYDPEAGTHFVTFATPTVLGVIKHYLRDHTWMLKAPRRLREKATTVRKLRGPLEQKLGRPPTVAELAEAAGISEERLVETMEVGWLYHVASTDAVRPDGENDSGEAYREAVGSLDPSYAEVEERESLRRALQELDEREREIITARFFGEASQSQVAQRLGISQMHVSRLERRALQRLREVMDSWQK